MPVHNSIASQRKNGNSSDATLVKLKVLPGANCTGSFLTLLFPQHSHCMLFSRKPNKKPKTESILRTPSRGNRMSKATSINSGRKTKRMLCAINEPVFCLDLWWQYIIVISSLENGIPSSRRRSGSVIHTALFYTGSNPRCFWGTGTAGDVRYLLADTLIRVRLKKASRICWPQCSLNH